MVSGSSWGLGYVALLTTGRVGGLLIGLVVFDLSDPSLLVPRTSSFFRGVVGSWMTCLVFPDPDTTTTLPFLISPFSWVLNLLSRMLSNSASCSIVREEMAGLEPGLVTAAPPSVTVMPRAWGGTVTRREP